MITLNENKKLFIEAQELRQKARARIHKSALNSYSGLPKRTAFKCFRTTLKPVTKAPNCCGL